MNNITTENIKEIAEQLDIGFRAFVHKTTGQLLFVPNQSELLEIDMESWAEDLEELENNFMDYFEFEKWSSRDSFSMMADFAEHLTANRHLQSRLYDALNKKKPFREFKFVIDNSGDYRQQWFDFKNKWQQDFVVRQLNFDGRRL
ncbi:MAG: hypothetical protein IPM42_11760 [Saprospiraceae bacterium]|nr:hypothetical protein [Saprospiraceae bacterium]